MTTEIFVDYTLVRINHYRCDEPAGKWGLTTYVWVPKTMTVTEFDDLIEKAQQEYFKAKTEQRKLLPALSPGYSPQYDKYPDKTVAEVKAIHSAAEAEWKKRSEVIKAVERTFTQILKDVSNGVVKGFWDVTLPLSVDLHWGHRHGEQIEYDETKITDPRPNNFDAPEEDDTL